MGGFSDACEFSKGLAIVVSDFSPSLAIVLDLVRMVGVYKQCHVPLIQYFGVTLVGPSLIRKPHVPVRDTKVVRGRVTVVQPHTVLHPLGCRSWAKRQRAVVFISSGLFCKLESTAAVSNIVLM